jgi:hypothetical protein
LEKEEDPSAGAGFTADEDLEGERSVSEEGKEGER